jgi:hypothetical protein
MRLTGLALAALFLPAALANCHDVGALCKKRENNYKTACECGMVHEGRVRIAISALAFDKVPKV